MAEAVSEEDIAKGLVDEHVDYLRRRKLCMYLGNEKTHDVDGVLQLGCFRECRLKLTLTYTMDRYLFLKFT